MVGGGGGGVKSENSVCPRPLLQFLQFFQFMSDRLHQVTQVTSGYISLRRRDGTWSSTICLGTGRDNNGEVTFHSDNIKTAIVQVGSGGLQEKKTGTRQGENREKIGRR